MELRLIHSCVLNAIVSYANLWLPQRSERRTEARGHTDESRLHERRPPEMTKRIPVI